MVEKTKKNNKPLTANDLLKYEIAAELGLTKKILDSGWKSLTARESGRIGGIMAKRRKNYKLSLSDIDEFEVEEIRLE